MFHMLASKAFENINVNEICEYTNYPRATFYNYFDDKFDLLNYCWYCLCQHIRLDEYDKMDPNESLYIFFDRIYDLIKANNEMIRVILQHNTEASYLFSSFRTYMKSLVRMIFDKCSIKHDYLIPSDMVAEHYCNILLLVSEWCLEKDRNCTKNQAHEYLRHLVGEL